MSSSRSPYRRRLKKDIRPYHNRAIDVWIWGEYFREMREVFNSTFDAFGQLRPVSWFQFHYWKRHFSTIEFFESHDELILLQLMKDGWIEYSDLMRLKDFELGVIARLEVTKQIERELRIFIYENDLEYLVKSPRSFSSFLLAVGALLASEGRAVFAPDWTGQGNFCVPRVGHP